MKYLFLFAGLLFSACMTEPENKEVVVGAADTLAVNNVDTLVINNVDTVVVKNVDTVVFRDTIFSMDTVFNVDTIFNVDTVFSMDTVFNMDTVYSVDTLKISRLDTLVTYTRDTVFSTSKDTIIEVHQDTIYSRDTVIVETRDTVVQVHRDTVVSRDTVFLGVPGQWKRKIVYESDLTNETPTPHTFGSYEIFINDLTDSSVPVLIFHRISPLHVWAKSSDLFYTANTGSVRVIVSNSVYSGFTSTAQIMVLYWVGDVDE